MRSETDYRKELIGRLELMFPGCFIIKTDPTLTQGIPDLLVLWENQWFMLEIKLSEYSPFQPNQPFYVDKFNKMSFAAFVWPEIEEQVLYDCQTALGVYH